MRRMTSEERLATPGYEKNVRLFKAIYILFAIGVIGAWLSAKLLPADTNLASSGLMEVVRFAVPSVDLLARRCPDPSLATVVYGLQWLLAPCYLVLLFMMPPWSSTSRAAIRYAARLQSPPVAAKALLLLIVCLLIIYFMGDFRLFYFPTFLNGGMAPGNDPDYWLAGIYRSYFALGIYGAVAVACECFLFWLVVFFCGSMDIWLLGHGVKVQAEHGQVPPQA